MLYNVTCVWLVIESWAFSSRPAICGSWHVPRRSYHVTSHCAAPYNWSCPRAGWRCHYAPLFLFFMVSTSAFCKSQLGQRQEAFSFLEDFHCQCHVLSYYAYPLTLAFGFLMTNRHFLKTSSMDVWRPQFKSILTLRLLISYIYGAPSKARNDNVVYIWTYVWQRWNSLFRFAAQCFNTESMQRGFLCHIFV